MGFSPFAVETSRAEHVRSSEGCMKKRAGCEAVENCGLADTGDSLLRCGKMMRKRPKPSLRPPVISVFLNL
jgi:hypothetical protein